MSDFNVKACSIGMNVACVLQTCAFGTAIPAALGMIAILGHFGVMNVGLFAIIGPYNAFFLVIGGLAISAFFTLCAFAVGFISCCCQGKEIYYHRS